MKIPYTYISCPCTEVSTTKDPISTLQGEDGEEQEKTFDPHSPRANFSLYPPEHLLYCEECQQIRCPRCILEEIVCWYCPSCLFEMPITMVRSEGGRCPRNCFNCPVCTAPLSTNSLNPDPSTRAVTGPFILSCGYCDWSSLDIGWQFEKLSNIQAQMARLSMGISSNMPSSPRTPGTPSEPEPVTSSGPDARFNQLKSFYSSQLAKSSNTDPLLSPTGGLNYSSPASLQRILSIYNPDSRKKGNSKVEPMRESADASEGLCIVTPDHDRQIIQRLQNEGWASTASIEQRSLQKHPSSIHFTSDLRPTPTLLRTKRNKRCRTCRHILVKPEPKVQNTRFRIRLLALNYIPSINVAPLHPAPSTQLPPIDLHALPAGRAHQFLFTLKNPLFDPVQVTLATPPQTPGRYGHRVTILCPEFTIGPNVDQWDEALADGSRSKRSSQIMLGPAATIKPEYVGGEGGKVAEAGKVWERSRNWTSVVVEVVCVPIVHRSPRAPPRRWKGKGKASDTVDQDDRVDMVDDLGNGSSSDEEEGEDEDVLEIPMFVRMEWEGDVVAGGGGGSSGGGVSAAAVVAAAANEGRDAAGVKGEGKEKRELTFWTVVGIGRVLRGDEE